MSHIPFIDDEDDAGNFAKGCCIAFVVLIGTILVGWAVNYLLEKP